MQENRDIRLNIRADQAELIVGSDAISRIGRNGRKCAFGQIRKKLLLQISCRAVAVHAAKQSLTADKKAA